MTQAGFKVVRVIKILRGVLISHCGGGTGAEEWSVSPGRGALGSEELKPGKRSTVLRV